MRHSQALRIAEGLVARLRPGCERIEIAGSIRRGKPEVKDIEILAQPICRTPRPVFGQQANFKTMLDPILFGMLLRHEMFAIKGGDKYRQFHIFETDLTPIVLDLFLVTPPAQWGVQLVIRTGPNKPENNFSQWMVTSKSKGGALPDGFQVDRGAVWKVQTDTRTEIYPTPEEADFFTLCGMEYVEPAQRIAKWRHLS